MAVCKSNLISQVSKLKNSEQDFSCLEIMKGEKSMLVKVINTSVRHNNILYTSGQTFQMQEEDYKGMEEYLQIIEEDSQEEVEKENNEKGKGKKK